MPKTLKIKLIITLIITLILWVFFAVIIWLFFRYRGSFKLKAFFDWVSNTGVSTIIGLLGLIFIGITGYIWNKKGLFEKSESKLNKGTNSDLKIYAKIEKIKLTEMAQKT